MGGSVGKWPRRAGGGGARQRDAAMTQNKASATATSKTANTARLRLPRKMWEMALPMSTGCRVPKRVLSPRLTGSVFRYSMSEKRNNVHATAPTVQRQAISANVNAGRRNAARKPSSVGEVRDIHIGS